MRYTDILDKDKTARREALRKRQTLYLYSAIVKDFEAILKILLPSDQAMVVGQHIKTIIQSIIELKTGKRPGKF